YYTKMLAWFTGVLATVSIGQGYILYRADQTARQAAEAAKLSADATIGALEHAQQIERAFVFLEDFDIELHTAHTTETDLSSLPEEYRSRPDLWITRFAVI